MSNEADTCRKYITPAIVRAGWDTDPHSINEQVTFTDGRIIPVGQNARRKDGKRADYILRYRRDLAIAVVEAKADEFAADTGLQQAKDYAEILGLKFAYATNGLEIVEYDYLTGKETIIPEFPTPADLWQRFQASLAITDEDAHTLLEPYNHDTGKSPRYYQEIAINRTVEAILQGQKRMLLTLATGTGKTVVAFQICWKLWNMRWNRSGAYRRPKILYLADRNILVDDPKDKTFAVFEDARIKIENGQVVKSRDIYFAIYQALAKDERRSGLYREYAPDFFDLIIVDECHRGSANAEGNWREILEYFQPAIQLGLTATPLRDDNRDTYAYFGNPLYTYSLRQGIEDGFLAPYRVHKILTEWDAAGWRPSQEERDRYGREIPQDEYTTEDFERIIALRARTEAVARHLTDFLKETDRFAKTIVFCVDQEHANEMRRALNNCNTDLTQRYPDYVCRVTSDEGQIGRGHLSRFQDLEQQTPVILTTSQMLTTGVDAPTCKNVVLVRPINSMTEFKQIIGRGTRVRDDYGKLFFNILDYAGSVTDLFKDPAFDGDPALVTQQEIDRAGTTKPGTQTVIDNGPDDLDDDQPGTAGGPTILPPDTPTAPPRKFYVDGGRVEIVAHMVYDLDDEGNRLEPVRLTDYTAEKTRTLYPSPTDLRNRWASPQQRAEIIAQFRERGIDFNDLTAATGQSDADPFDLLCNLAYSAPIRTRRERVSRLHQEQRAFFAQYGPQARAILEDLLEKYAQHGATEFAVPDVLRLPPISQRGTVSEIIKFFGGPQQLRQAVEQLQTLLYAA